MKKLNLGFFFTLMLLAGFFTANAAGLQQVGQWSGDIYCGNVLVQDQKAYIYDSHRLVILDLAVPASPQKLGEITLPMDITDLYVSGDYAYAVTGFENVWSGNNDRDGLRIIDISDSSSPREVGFYYKLSPRCVYISGQYAYVGSAYVDTTGYHGSFDIVDLSVPSSPQMLGQYSSEGIEDILSVDKTTYAVYNTESRISGHRGVLTVDTTAPASPLKIEDFITYSWGLNTEEGDAHPQALSRSGNFLFLATNTYPGGVGNNRLYIMDIANPGSMKQLSTYANSYLFKGMAQSGVYLYIASENEVAVLDLSDPHSPKAASRPFTSGAPLDLAASGDYIYVASGDSGLTILSAAAINSPPFGTFETPVQGAVLRSSIPVSGWVLDDKDIASVKIFRQPAAGEGKSLIYLGDAVLVEGARPDVKQAYPAYPMNSRAGWGYMLLTNFNMPNQGNGPVTLVAVATDSSGVQTTLGSKTITLDNAHAVKPFGANDTPRQGATISGANYINWGWALTPLPNTIPIDGSTIAVYVDGVNLGHPVYNRFRQDIADYFPGYNNSSGAVGYFFLDTTRYANGLHTIAWSVSDNAGNADGIGSRYFTIKNPANREGTSASLQGTTVSPTPPLKHALSHPDLSSPVKTREGFCADVPTKIHFPDENGTIRVETRETGRIEIHLGVDSIPGTGNSEFPAFSLLSPQPVGSFFDRAKGIFYWQPGPGVKGTFNLVFIKRVRNGEYSRQTVQVRIRPPSS